MLSIKRNLFIAFVLLQQKNITQWSSTQSYRSNNNSSSRSIIKITNGHFERNHFTGMCRASRENRIYNEPNHNKKKLFAWSKKSPFLALKVHILFSYDRQDKTVKFPFLSSPLSVGFCFIAASVVFPFCFF